MNSVLEQILATDTVKTPAGESLPLHSHIEANGGAFLQNVITQVKPKVSLEIGLAYGISALFICDALATLPTAHHIIIDPFQTISWHGVGLNNLRTANFGAMIDFREKFSHSALAELVEAKTVIDFAFVDGAHTFDYVLLDFVYIDRLLSVGGVIVFDDSTLPAIAKVIRYILTNHHYKVYDSYIPRDLFTWRRKAIYAATQRVSSLKRLLAPEFTLPNHHLGFPDTRLIALIKQANDDRPWDFHQEF